MNPYAKTKIDQHRLVSRVPLPTVGFGVNGTIIKQLFYSSGSYIPIFHMVLPKELILLGPAGYI